MISDELLKMLRCPACGEPLRQADEQLLARLNRRVEAGNLENRAGQKLDRPLESGLLAVESGVVYPVYDDIPDLVADDGIPLDQLEPEAPNDSPAASNS